MSLRTVAASGLCCIALLGCVNQPSNESQTTDSPEPSVELSLAEKLASDTRPQTDRTRDVGRKPREVIEFLGIAPGMRVMDILAYSGYYTEVLSHAVGSSGSVLSQNPAHVLELSNGANDKALTQRLRHNRLPNVTRVNREFDDLGIAPDSLDGAITALNLHDLYHRSPNHAIDVLRQIYRVLKPGGIFGVIDHIGIEGRDNVQLHRMTKAQALDVLEAAGFTVEEESNLLSNPYDDHTLFVFGPELRGITDRFLFRAIKPADG